ncbi:MAG: hypothetical protein HYT70_03005 [Candidatus Aenigmarchaeota archaeon]|nr:hypothetical protein [Candidatus Aenigmarchaeota archaeon]
MAKARKQSYKHLILSLFVIAAALVFALIFTIVLIPAILARFGYGPVIIFIVGVMATVSSMMAILFYLILKGEIKI